MNAVFYARLGLQRNTAQVCGSTRMSHNHARMAEPRWRPNLHSLVGVVGSSAWVVGLITGPRVVRLSAQVQPPPGGTSRRSQSANPARHRRGFEMARLSASAKEPRRAFGTPLHHPHLSPSKVAGSANGNDSSRFPSTMNGTKITAAQNNVSGLLLSRGRLSVRRS